jgi:type I restriction enzyme M protein
MVSRKLRELTDEDIEQIAGTYHSWRNHEGGYEDVAGFARAASIEEIAEHDFVLTPGRYVGAVEVESDGEPIGDKIQRLTSELFTEFERGRMLEDEVRLRLGSIQ